MKAIAEFRHACRLGLYLLTLGFAASSYYATRGRDGNSTAMLWCFSALGIAYVVLFVQSTKNILSAQSLLHAILYPVSCAAAMLDTHLDEMAGMLPAIVGASAFAIVAVGAIANATAKVIARRQHT